MIRKIKDNSSWTVTKVLKAVRAACNRIEGYRLSVSAEERQRLLPLLIILKRLTKRKKPGFHASLKSIGLNASTVRSWFYRGLPTDKIIELLEPEEKPVTAQMGTVGSPVPPVPAVKPNINLIAAELVRDIESPARREKLEAVVRHRNLLNQATRKNLITALGNSARESHKFIGQLSKDFSEGQKNGKGHQRVRRERMAKAA